MQRSKKILFLCKNLMFPFFFQQQKKPDTSSATVISSAGSRLTSIHTSGGHARGQKGRGGRAQNNMSEIQQQEMNDIQVRVIKDNNEHIPNNSEATVEVEAAPSVSALQAMASTSEGVSTASPPVVVEAAQVTKALVNDHHLGPESNGASTSSAMAASSSSAMEAERLTSGVEEVPQVKISNL